jgi:hypothetical protein
MRGDGRLLGLLLCLQQSEAGIAMLDEVAQPRTVTLQKRLNRFLVAAVRLDPPSLHANFPELH